MGDAMEVDARGQKCPWPALRLARTIRQNGDVRRFTLLADDPAAERDIPQLAAENGWRLEELPRQGAAFHWLIEVARQDR